ncbi:MAG: cytochrome C [Geobacteraceae bacterium GWC2_58_44]|nr:MAG: cytochrome C [Geobacteraceae bacterium GWC2_58_44]HBG04356.1 cytochrome C [Geobacter sp.]
MAQTFTTLRRYLVLLVLLAAAGNARADAGKELFDEQCAGCHTIGGGDGGGPDLKGITAKRPAEWLVRVIAEPDKLTAEKDPVQLELVKKYGMEMPNVGVSRDDARKIVAFLQGGSAPAEDGAPAAGGTPAPGAGEAGTPQAPNQAELVVTGELLATGRDLFTGKQPFAKGGASCVSCHGLRYPGVNGGLLAADLTGLYEKMGENGTRGVLKSLGFPVMKKIYADRPLSEQEITALTALFKDAAARKHQASDPYPLAGLGFFALCIVGAIMFKRRIR